MPQPAGVSRFDGYEFTTFTMKDGLPDNVIHEIYEDYKGRIWFVSYSGQLSYFFDGKIYPYKYNYLMTGLLSGGKGIVKCSFRVFRDNTILISVNRKGIFKISQDGKVVKQYSNLSASLIFDFHNDLGFPALTFDISNLVVHNTLIVKDSITYLPADDFRNVNPSHLFAAEKNGQYVISFGETFVIVKNLKTTSHESKKPIIWISRGSDGLVWVSRYNGGLYCYNDVNIDKGELIKLFDGLSITSVCKDKEGGVLVFRPTQMVFFYISNINSNTFFWDTYRANGKKIMVIEKTPTGIWTGFDNGDISIINEEKTRFQNVIIPNPSKSELYVNSIFYNQNSHDILLLSNLYVYKVKSGNVVRFPQRVFSEGSR